MENDGIDFTYLRFFAKPSKFIFTKYQISLNLTLYIKLLIPRNIFQEQYRNPTFYLETFTDTRCSNGQLVFKMEIYILPETPRAIASTSSRLDEGIDHYHAREDR